MPPTLAVALPSCLALAGLVSMPAAHAGPAEQALAQKYACMSCHSQAQKLVGPSFDAIKARYAGDPKAMDSLVAVVQKGGSGVWGPVPMPGNPQISESDARTLVAWILGSP
jgi:cytochrome c